MRSLFIHIALWFCLTSLVFSQSKRSTKIYGAIGLATTEEFLAGLDLPAWVWGGAHVFENVAKNYSLVEKLLLDEFLNNIPAKGVNDPQHILDDAQRRSIEKLIAAHDVNSAMPLHVNVLGYGQKLSITEGNLKTRLQKLYRDKNAIVVFYYYGYVRGVKGYVFLDTIGLIEDWEVGELFLKSSRAASVEVEDILEMEYFIKYVSKRSYWLEQKLIPPALDEESRNEEIIVKESKKEWGVWLLIIKYQTLVAVSSLLILTCVGWYLLWSRRWRRFALLNRDVSVRLGANHGANVSDALEFSNSKTSLSEQYEKLKSKEL